MSGLIGDEWGAKQETAVHLDIRPCELSQYLGGNKRPGEELLRKVSEMFGVSYEKLYSVAHLWKSCQTDYDTDSSLSRLQRASYDTPLPSDRKSTELNL